MECFPWEVFEFAVSLPCLLMERMEMNVCFTFQGSLRASSFFLNYNQTNFKIYRSVIVLLM